ncbi:MAG: hypothetical protein INH41_31105 [Myxococcaceae bacterium]|jgi:hypothetical protein|nr:hypothetical protein [Myxococcaceae bacterium]MCA3016856.1 hypothetical protein [Myxococcaceae bacterium]
MTQPERRTRRSSEAHRALSLFLEAVRTRESVEALAVTTEDGLLVAGAGKHDLEWMGSVGASSKRATLTWNERTLHVQRFTVNQVQMYLTSTDKKVDPGPVQAGLERILGGS